MRLLRLLTQRYGYFQYVCRDTEHILYFPAKSVSYFIDNNDRVDLVATDGKTHRLQTVNLITTDGKVHELLTIDKDGNNLLEWLINISK